MDSPPAAVNALAAPPLDARFRMLENISSRVDYDDLDMHFSVEALTDCLLLLYDECSKSTLKKEKLFTDFVELGKFFITKFFPKRVCVCASTERRTCCDDAGCR